jgi:hypothetical protein
MDDLDMLKLLGAAHGLQARELSKQEQAKLDNIRAELRAIRSEQERQKRLPQCPVCGGRLEGQFRKCMHCTSDLVWLEGLPCEPGKEDVLLARLAANRSAKVQAQQDKAKRREEQRRFQEGLALIPEYSGKGWSSEQIAAELTRLGYEQDKDEPDSPAKVWTSEAVESQITWHRDLASWRSRNRIWQWLSPVISLLISALGISMLSDLPGALSVLLFVGIFLLSLVPVFFLGVFIFVGDPPRIPGAYLIRK